MSVWLHCRWLVLGRRMLTWMHTAITSAVSSVVTRRVGVCRTTARPSHAACSQTWSAPGSVKGASSAFTLTHGSVDSCSTRIANRLVSPLLLFISAAANATGHIEFCVVWAKEFTTRRFMTSVLLNTFKTETAWNTSVWAAVNIIWHCCDISGPLDRGMT